MKKFKRIIAAVLIFVMASTTCLAAGTSSTTITPISVGKYPAIIPTGLNDNFIVVNFEGTEEDFSIVYGVIDGNGNEVLPMTVSPEAIDAYVDPNYQPPNYFLNSTLRTYPGDYVDNNNDNTGFTVYHYESASKKTAISAQILYTQDEVSSGLNYAGFDSVSYCIVRPSASSTPDEEEFNLYDINGDLIANNIVYIYKQYIICGDYSTLTCSLEKLSDVPKKAKNLPDSTPSPSPSITPTATPTATATPSTTPTLVATKLSTPKSVKVTKSKKNYVASWKKVENNNGYSVKLFKNGKCVKSLSTKKNVQKISLSKYMKKNGKYYVSIRAKGTASKYNPSQYGKSKIIKVK